MSETKTETVVVDDANAAHALIGRSIGGQAVAFFTASGIEVRFFTLGQDDITGYRRWGTPVEVDALPPATMWVRLDQVIGQTIPGHNIEVRRVNYRRNPDGWIWHGYEPHAGSHLHLDDDGMVEVLAPVPEVEAADEVTVREAAEWLVAIYSPLDFTEPRIAEAWADLVAALAADRGEA